MTSKLRDVYVHETKNQKHLNLDGFLGFPLVSFGFSLAELGTYRDLNRLIIGLLERIAHRDCTKFGSTRDFSLFSPG